MIIYHDNYDNSIMNYSIIHCVCLIYNKLIFYLIKHSEILRQGPKNTYENSEIKFLKCRFQLRESLIACFLWVK